MTEAANAGYRVMAMGGDTAFGGREVVALMSTTSDGKPRDEDKLIGISRTSTLQKELEQVGQAGFQSLAMTLGQTAIGGQERVVITRRLLQ